MITRIPDFEKQILQEIADKRLHRKTVALTYAFGIRQDQGDINWPRINKAIIDRWSESGLRWVKSEAWAWVERT